MTEIKKSQVDLQVKKNNVQNNSASSSGVTNPKIKTKDTQLFGHLTTSTKASPKSEVADNSVKNNISAFGTLTTSPKSASSVSEKLSIFNRLEAAQASQPITGSLFSTSVASDQPKVTSEIEADTIKEAMSQETSTAGRRFDSDNFAEFSDSAPNSEAVYGKFDNRNKLLGTVGRYTSGNANSLFLRQVSRDYRQDMGLDLRVGSGQYDRVTSWANDTRAQNGNYNYNAGCGSSQRPSAPSGQGGHPGMAGEPGMPSWGVTTPDMPVHTGQRPPQKPSGGCGPQQPQHPQQPPSGGHCGGTSITHPNNRNNLLDMYSRFSSGNANSAFLRQVDRDFNQVMSLDLKVGSGMYDRVTCAANDTRLRNASYQYPGSSCGCSGGFYMPEMASCCYPSTAASVISALGNGATSVIGAFANSNNSPQVIISAAPGTSVSVGGANTGNIRSEGVSINNNNNSTANTLTSTANGLDPKNPTHSQMKATSDAINTGQGQYSQQRADAYEAEGYKSQIDKDYNAQDGTVKDLELQVAQAETEVTAAQEGKENAECEQDAEENSVNGCKKSCESAQNAEQEAADAVQNQQAIYDKLPDKITQTNADGTTTQVANPKKAEAKTKLEQLQTKLKEKQEAKKEADAKLEEAQQRLDKAKTALGEAKAKLDKAKIFQENQNLLWGEAKDDLKRLDTARTNAANDLTAKNSLVSGTKSALDSAQNKYNQALETIGSYAQAGSQNDSSTKTASKSSTSSFGSGFSGFGNNDWLYRPIGGGESYTGLSKDSIYSGKNDIKTDGNLSDLSHVGMAGCYTYTDKSGSPVNGTYKDGDKFVKLEKGKIKS